MNNMTAENTNVEKRKIEQVNAHVCYYTDKVCLNCRYFDSHYHGGYCDFQKVDTSPTNSCSDFWDRVNIHDKICQNCSAYYGGYCEIHKVNTPSTNSCGNFWNRATCATNGNKDETSQSCRNLIPVVVALTVALTCCVAILLRGK